MKRKVRIIELLLELYKKATPGKWEVSQIKDLIYVPRGEGYFSICEMADDASSVVDAPLIATMHNTLPEVIGGFETMRGALEQITVLAGEWEANQLGNAVFQKLRWRRLTSIAKNALDAVYTRENQDEKDSLL